MSDVLVLNMDYQALNIASLQRAVRLILAGKAEVLHSRPRTMHARVFEMPMPSIVRMLYYIKRPMQRVGLTKKNVLLRDDYTCQYCGVYEKRFLTVDHVMPKSRGGPSSFENLVAACLQCNGRKNNRTPEEAGMKLRRKPFRPKYIPWIVVTRNTDADEWGKFLSLYNVSIEDRVS